MRISRRELFRGLWAGLAAAALPVSLVEAEEPELVLETRYVTADEWHRYLVTYDPGDGMVTEWVSLDG